MQENAGNGDRKDDAGQLVAFDHETEAPLRPQSSIKEAGDQGCIQRMLRGAASNPASRTESSLVWCQCVSVIFIGGQFAIKCS